MFAPDGYVSLAKLWETFEETLGEWCQARTLECMDAESFAPADVFGTALDLTEDIFIRTLDRFDLFLIPASGKVLTVQPVLQPTGARLLAKLTVFESVMVVRTPEEAGPHGEWLNQLGSSRFRSGEVLMSWVRDTRPPLRSDLEPFLLAPVFATLPVFFERAGFVTARDTPPWAEDIIEDAFLKALSPRVHGASICVTEEIASHWLKEITPASALPILRELVPSVDFGEEDAVKVGRPRKLERVAAALQELELVRAGMTWKLRQRRVEEYLGEPVSESVLYRAAKLIDK